MTKRDDAAAADVTAQRALIIESDSFLTELSRGIDPSCGADPLAASLLKLRDEVENPMPPAPVIDGADGEAEVVSLPHATKRRRVNPILTGLVGLAAGVALMAGSGAVLYQADPSSPLHGVRNAIFGSDNRNVVELASTLQEMENKAAAGDIDGARQLLNQARKQLDDAAPESVQKLNQAEQDLNQREAASHTVTVTATVSAPAPAATTQNPDPVLTHPNPTEEISVSSAPTSTSQEPSFAASVEPTASAAATGNTYATAVVVPIAPAAQAHPSSAAKEAGAAQDAN